MEVNRYKITEDSQLRETTVHYGKCENMGVPPWNGQRQMRQSVRLGLHYLFLHDVCFCHKTAT